MKTRRNRVAWVFQHTDALCVRAAAMRLDAGMTRAETLGCDRYAAFA